MTHSIRIYALAAGLTLSATWSLWAQSELPPPEPQAGVPDANVETPEGMEVLTSGPIHEAFAEAVRYKAEPGLTVDREPPPLIEEQPPEARPEGDDVIWIPGYWGWDDEANDFIWITGVYRNRPPGQRWVPGYWAQEGTQWQWVSGFWVPDELEEVTYLPEPPETLDQGPSSPAPGSNYFWNPGCWNWSGARYVWRAGFWTPYQQNWVWYPTYYSWTPRGYVCCYGRWDRPWATRGLCFAPVRYTRPLYLNAGYYYRPWVAFNSGAFAWNLFIRPGYGHYYVGNYFGANYQNFGYRPWYSYGRSRYGFDPFYNYYRWSYGRNNPRWENDVRNRFDRMQAENYRGPRDFRDYRRDYDRLDQRDRLAVTLAQLERNTTRQGDTPRVVPVRNRDQFQDMTRDFRELNNRRRQIEIARDDNRPSGPGRNPRVDANARLELPPVARTQTRVRTNANAARAEAVRRDTAERRREFTNADRAREMNNRARDLNNRRTESLRPNIDQAQREDRNRAAERAQAIENANRARNAERSRATTNEAANRARNLANERARTNENIQRARERAQNAENAQRIRERAQALENGSRARDDANRARDLANERARANENIQRARERAQNAENAQRARERSQAQENANRARSIQQGQLRAAERARAIQQNAERARQLQQRGPSLNPADANREQMNRSRDLQNRYRELQNRARIENSRPSTQRPAVRVNPSPRVEQPRPQVQRSFRPPTPSVTAPRGNGGGGQAIRVNPGGAGNVNRGARNPGAANRGGVNPGGENPGGRGNRGRGR